MTTADAVFAEMFPMTGESESGDYVQTFGYEPGTVYEHHIPADLPPYGTEADHSNEHYIPVGV